jgi:D-alanyl-D-alanine endopeptidase (penicillin-binding protein 7)
MPTYKPAHWLLAPTLLIVLGMVSVSVQARPQKHSQRQSQRASGPALKSNAVLVLDETSSQTLLAKNASEPSPIASITKLMTALVVLDARQPLNESVEISRDDRAEGKGAVSRLPYGTSLTRSDLLHLALMSSENRAAHALGRNYPGGLAACVAAMNAKARQLGMTNTRFVDPTGLSSSNVASPEDLVKLVNAAAHNETIREYSTDRKHTVAIGRHQLEFRTTNSLVANPTWNVVVQKTGYIAEAGRCLVMKAIIDGRSIVIVLLDSFGKYTRVADAKRVKDWMERPLVARSAVR